jgi:Cu/Ag efflux protein CusF
MRYLKMLGLAAAAAAALMAFVGAGSASAATSTLCSASESPCTNNAWPLKTALDFSLKTGSSAKLVDTNNNTLDTCTGAGTTVAGKLETDSTKGTLAGGAVSALNWETCTKKTKTIKTGGLSVEGGGGGNGTVKATGEFKIEIDTETLFGICEYGVTAGTTLGEIKEGNPATFVANAVASRLGGGFACPTTAKWTAEYTVTSPSNTTLYVSAS